MSTPNMRHKLFSCLLYINVSYTQLCYYFPILWYFRSTRFFAFIFLFFRYPNTQTQLLLLFIYSLVWQMYFLATSPFNSVVLLFLVYFIFFLFVIRRSLFYYYHYYFLQQNKLNLVPCFAYVSLFYLFVYKSQRQFYYCCACTLLYVAMIRSRNATAAFPAICQKEFMLKYILWGFSIYNQFTRKPEYLKMLRETPYGITQFKIITTWFMIFLFNSMSSSVFFFCWHTVFVFFAELIVVNTNTKPYRRQINIYLRQQRLRRNRK